MIATGIVRKLQKLGNESGRQIWTGGLFRAQIFYQIIGFGLIEIFRASRTDDQTRGVEHRSGFQTYLMIHEIL